MKMLVNVKRAVQEYDLDSGISRNYLVIVVGGAEHRIEATEQQLQQAIVDAQVAGQKRPAATHAPAGAPPREELGAPMLGDIYEDEPEEEPPNIEDIAQALLAEGHAEEDVVRLLQQQYPEQFQVPQAAPPPPQQDIAPTLFEDFSGQATDEELAEYTGQNIPAGDIDISSDDISGGGQLAAVITGFDADRNAVRRDPSTGKQRNMSAAQAARIDKIRATPHLSQSRMDNLAELRQKARRVPSRSVQADSAGNPVVAQTMQLSAPVTRETGTIGTLPGADDEGFPAG